MIGVKRNPDIKKQESIKVLYSIYHSYTIVAEKVKLSKQRIHQIVKNYHNFGYQGREKLYRKTWKPICELCNNKTKVLHHKDFDNTNDTIENLQSLCGKHHAQAHKAHNRKIYASRCSSCNRKFGTEVNDYRLKEGLCNCCHSIKNGTTNGKNLFYPNTCIDCGAETKGKKRKLKRCERCFARFRYATNEKYRKYHSDYYKSRRKNPEYDLYCKERNKQYYIKKLLP